MKVNGHTQQEAIEAEYLIQNGCTLEHTSALASAVALRGGVWQGFWWEQSGLWFGFFHTQPKWEPTATNCERRRLFELHSLWATAFLKIILTSCGPTGGRKILSYSSPTSLVGKGECGGKSYSLQEAECKIQHRTHVCVKLKWTQASSSSDLPVKIASPRLGREPPRLASRAEQSSALW